MRLDNFNVPDKFKHLPQGVCCVIRQNSKPRSASPILLVSRKDDSTSFGLPGGKIDPGETPQQAIVREVKEETGLDIVLGPCIFKRMCPKHAPEGKDFYAFAFVAQSYSGEIATQEKGVVKWGTWAEQEGGQFARYNRGVQTSLYAYEDLVDGKDYLTNHEPTRMGIPILTTLRDDGPMSAKDLAEKLGYELETTTNALLHLRNAYLTDGLEGYFWRTTLRGQSLLDVY